jgi:hypothetical protein
MPVSVVAAAAAHTVRRPDIPNATVAIATSAQAAT